MEVTNDSAVGQDDDDQRHDVEEDHAHEEVQKFLKKKNSDLKVELKNDKLKNIFRL